ncbi:MAG: peptidoglycan DD-metalloendopeptidase family protein [Eubacterium sp.]
MKRKICLFITVLFCFSLLTSPVYAATQAELEQQKKEASDKKNAAQYQVDMTQTTMEGIENEIRKANAEIDKISGQIATLDGEIQGINANLDKTKIELEETEKKQVQQEIELKERLRVMYMYGNEGYVEVLFSSTDFADFITKADMMKSVMQADKDSARTLEKTKTEVANKKAAIESDKVKIEKAKTEQQVILSNQENIKTQKNQLLEKNKKVVESYTAEIQKQQAVMDKADNDLAAIAREKQAEADRIRAEKAAQAEREQAEREEAEKNDGGTGGGSSGGGESSTPAPAPSTGLIWPINAAYHPTYWDDMFGWRVPPFAGASSYHAGCDMAAPSGEPVWSPGDGVVTFAGSNGGYGNCVMIAVDGGTVLYGHLSDYYVSEGQYVRQGETVAAVGTTGTSSGNHLHLSFLVDGDYVDPLNYMHW